MPPKWKMHLSAAVTEVNALADVTSVADGSVSEGPLPKRRCFSAATETSCPFPLSGWWTLTKSMPASVGSEPPEGGSPTGALRIRFPRLKVTLVTATRIPVKVKS